MKTSILTTLSLCLLYLCISYSQPLSSTCKCGSSDDVCWDFCLYSNQDMSQFSESNALPCGLIRTAQIIANILNAWMFLQQSLGDVPHLLLLLGHVLLLLLGHLVLALQQVRDKIMSNLIFGVYFPQKRNPNLL